MEVILKDRHSDAWKYRILHVCGGDPIRSITDCHIKRYSPRMWRWSSYNRTYALEEPVFSTYVEVIPLMLSIVLPPYCILHVCGGDPGLCKKHSPISWYSPRMWRWSHKCPLEMWSRNVFSTYVEVILPLMPSPARFFGILHVCGGDPTNSTEKAYVDTVFSTYVEVIPNQDYHRGQQWCILHVCGGDP